MSNLSDEKQVSVGEGKYQLVRSSLSKRCQSICCEGGGDDDDDANDNDGGDDDDDEGADQPAIPPIETQKDQHVKSATWQK